MVSDTGADVYTWDLPSHFPEPLVPEDNPMSVAKVRLGRRLFYDTALSGNGTQSCASCHEQSLAFTDGKAFAEGSTGERHPRSSMSLTNVAYYSTLGWSNPLHRQLEQQIPTPMFGQDPVELGLAGQEKLLLDRLRATPLYGPLFEAAFGDAQDAFSVEAVVQALASFMRTMISSGSPYDRWVQGDRGDFSEEAERGLELFTSEKFECFHCHGGFNLADSVNHADTVFEEQIFHNTGLYNVDGAGAFPEPNVGLIEFTGQQADMGKFRAPSLRNVEVTAPYMHDGSIGTLNGVLAHYGVAGRTLIGGANAGVGSDNPWKSPFLVGFEMTEPEQEALIAFLHSLTDPDFLFREELSNPWPQDEF